jgi:adenylate kinase
MPAPVALTGVPGTGKSAAAARLASRFRVVEVADLALAWGLATRVRSGVSVDVPRLARRYRRSPPDVDLVVGHLAHLLPVRDVVVLRCHPRVLARRLVRSHRGSARERRENYVAEALDFVLLEALRPGRRVWEVDTTNRTADAVARAVTRILGRRPGSRFGHVDWLADPAVTEHLLEAAD